MLNLLFLCTSSLSIIGWVPINRWTLAVAIDLYTLSLSLLAVVILLLVAERFRQAYRIRKTSKSTYAPVPIPLNRLTSLSWSATEHSPSTHQLHNIVVDMQTWVNSFESTARSRNIHLNFTQNRPYWQARYDSDSLQKIITTLLSNALTSTATGGQVQVEAVYDSEGLTIRVSDISTGILPDNAQPVPDRFRSGTMSGTYNLAVFQQNGAVNDWEFVRGLVDQLQGSMGVASVVGTGNTFTIWIPAVPDHTTDLFLSKG